jgi:hypothetical protein
MKLRANLVHADGKVLMGRVVIPNDVDVLLKDTRIRCGLISFSLQTRCNVVLETPTARQVPRSRPRSEVRRSKAAD